MVTTLIPEGFVIKSIPPQAPKLPPQDLESKPKILSSPPQGRTLPPGFIIRYDPSQTLPMAVPGSKYGRRLDGTSKGEGYFGPLKRPDGGISTELSIGVDFDGQETEIPLLIPTLTQPEIDLLLSGEKPTSEIVDKAVSHARMRLKQGKSPFALGGISLQEQISAPPPGATKVVYIPGKVPGQDPDKLPPGFTWSLPLEGAGIGHQLGLGIERDSLAGKVLNLMGIESRPDVQPVGMAETIARGMGGLGPDILTGLYSIGPAILRKVGVKMTLLLGQRAVGGAASFAVPSALHEAVRQVESEEGFEPGSLLKETAKGAGLGGVIGGVGGIIPGKGLKAATARFGAEAGVFAEYQALERGGLVPNPAEVGLSAAFLGTLKGFNFAVDRLSRANGISPEEQAKRLREDAELNDITVDKAIKKEAERISPEMQAEIDALREIGVKAKESIREEVRKSAETQGPQGKEVASMPQPEPFSASTLDLQTLLQQIEVGKISVRQTEKQLSPEQLVTFREVRKIRREQLEKERAESATRSREESNRQFREAITQNPTDKTIIAKMPGTGQSYFDAMGKDWLSFSREGRIAIIREDTKKLIVERGLAEEKVLVEKEEEIEQTRTEADNTAKTTAITQYAKSKGLAVEETGYYDSKYLTIETPDGDFITIRVSNHEQPLGGGFNIEKQKRHGEADISIDPISKKTIEDAKSLIDSFSPPPAALGMEPQPTATESVGDTPRVEPIKGYGPESLPQGEGVTAEAKAGKPAEPTAKPTEPTKNGLEKADIVNVPVSGIQTKYQPREGLNKEQISNIVENYDPNLFDPIVVNQEGSNRYVISGHHRLEASKRLGLKEVPAKIISVPGNEARKLAAQANENRLEHSPLEQAKIYSQSQAEGLSSEAIARQFNKNVFFVENRLLLNNLSANLKTALKNNAIPITHVTEFARASKEYRWNDTAQDEIFRSVYIPYGKNITANSFKLMLDHFAPQMAIEQTSLGFSAQKTDLKDRLAQFFRAVKELENKKTAYGNLIKATTRLGGEKSELPEIQALSKKQETFKQEIKNLESQISSMVSGAGFGAEKFKPPPAPGGYASISKEEQIPLYPELEPKFKKGDSVYLRKPRGTATTFYQVEDVQGSYYKLKGISEWVPETKLVGQPNLPGISGFASTGGYTKRPLRGIEPPEILELAKEINEGKYPQVVRKLRGAAAGRFYPKTGDIKLEAKLFKNTQEAMQTLAHEIGHLVDWLPDKIMIRGNILGRIATLKKYLKYSYENLSPTDKAKITTELKALSAEWRGPFEPTDKYRNSAKELYADALSVLINDPVLLEAKAPAFHKGFFDYLGRKPVVKEVYEEIQIRLTDSKATLEARDFNIKEMFKGGGEKIAEALRQEKLDRRSIIDDIKADLVDYDNALNQKVKEAKTRGIEIAPEDNPRYWYEELRYVASEINQYVRTLDTTIKTPANRGGVDDVAIGKYQFLRRVMTERASIANPLFQTKETALPLIEKMKADLGPERYATLEKAVNNYWALRSKDVIPLLEKAEMYAPEQMKLLKDNENYVTFLVQEFLEKTYGGAVTGHIYKQSGTLKDITNPFHATVMKDMALMRAALRKVAAEARVNFLLKHFPDEIKPAETRWNGKYQEPIEPKNPEEGMIVFLHKGKIQAYYVDKHISDPFNRDPIKAGLILKVFAGITQPLKEVLVSKNPFFILWNIQRDIKAFAKNIPEAGLYQALKYTIKAVPDAYKDVFKGVSTDTVAQMYKAKALIVGRYWSARDLTVDNELDRMMIEFGIRPMAYQNKVIAPFQKFWAWMDKPGQFTERLTKIGGYKFLKDMQKQGKYLSDKEIAHIVRVRIGSPDFKRGGHLMMLYNNVFPFSNAGKEGWRASVEAYKASPASYMLKTIEYDILPKLVMYGAAIGLLGPAIQGMMEAIPDRQKANYLTIPLGKTANGKTVYFLQPHDFTGQVVGAVLWEMMKPGMQTDTAQVVNYLAGGIPYSGLNPWLQTVQDTIQYMSGKNPYDSWRGRYVIPEQVFEAGGRDANEIFAKHVLNQMGASALIYRFKGDTVPEIQSELEKLIDLPIAGRAIERFLRVSNRGIVEELAEVSQEVRQKRAKELLVARRAIQKMIVKEPITTADMEALARHPSIIKESMIIGLSKRYGDVYTQALFSARSNEEKAAILNRIRELQTIKKADGKW